MLERIATTRLFGPKNLKPLRDDFQVIGVFNPGVIRVQNEMVLLVRVAEKPCNPRPGFVGLPRWDSDDQIVVDWTPESELVQTDPRVVVRKADGSLRLTSFSHLRIFRSPACDSPAWSPGPFLLPRSSMEEFGVEDPRIVKNETFWITYVAVSRHGVSTALASTRDFLNFERHGIIFSPENKDVVLFSQKVNGEYLALHRPTPRTCFHHPEVWLARSPDLRHWGQHTNVFCGRAAWESERVGAGTPPILLDEGWLEIYHGSRQPKHPDTVGIYSAGAILLDRDDPARILGRSTEPIMQPEADFERSGFVDDVVFPTGLIERDGILSVYYGAADASIGVVDFSRKELLTSLH